MVLKVGNRLRRVKMGADFEIDLKEDISNSCERDFSGVQRAETRMTWRRSRIPEVIVDNKFNGLRDERDKRGNRSWRDMRD